MIENPDEALCDEPLPIVSITLEAVTAEGLTSKIGRFLDFTQAEDVLRSWAGQQTARWPQGAPIRLAVEFPRRLVHTCDLIADASGLVRESPGESAADDPGFSSAGLMALRDLFAVSLRLAFANRTRSVGALRAKRVARIVLAYGDPA